ncbi:MAG TPA: hypothetical protein VJ976_08275 [Ornithinimicrobium sp.]|uniref:hypothetical protein n=1 Tax=Ornithinimicrobium sp. TaxID=1977084 RepID=UPI002B46F92F|nr:hypothetical protein [Ornithinimicrobium sp.]HKJ12368.1 hypothetical protein [Ornithinimicrobium sp.]
MRVIDRVDELSQLPGVADQVQQARKACEELRWHPALRRRIPEAAAESRVRGAAASAALEGAEVAGSRLSLTLVRDVMRGASRPPAQPDPQWQVLLGAVRVTAAAEQTTRATLSAPAQSLARLHMAAGSALLPSASLGRPRGGGEDCRENLGMGDPVPGHEVAERLRRIIELISGVAAGRQPTVLLSAVVHAELLAVRPFVAANGLLARALERVTLHRAGVDPTGVAVIEAGHARSAGGEYHRALSAYATGEPEGVAAWLVYAAGAVVDGAHDGVRVADAVLAGRTAG